MDLRRTGRIFGWLFIGTFVTSIPARLLFVDGAGASWANMRFVAADASSTSLKWGALLEFGLIVTQLGTALVLYPIARRQSETIALSYVAARTMESVFAAIGLVSMLSLVSVIGAMDGASGAEAVALQAQGDSLAHTYEWAFEWGPGLVAGIGNGILLGYLMYTSALVPPRLALLGLIGGPILILSFLMILAGRLQERRGTLGPADAPGGRVGTLARHLLRLEGIPSVEPTGRTDPREARRSHPADGTARLTRGALTGLTLASIMRPMPKRTHSYLVVRRDPPSMLLMAGSPVRGGRR